MDANLDFKTAEFKLRQMELRSKKNNTELNEETKAVISKIRDLQPLPTILTFEFNNVYAGGLKLKQEIGPELVKRFETLGCEYHQLDRGGQVTWHGQGQLVAYSLVDLKAFEKLSAKCFVSRVLLDSITKLLDKNFGIQSSVTENPGVWVTPNDKIASVGIRVKRGVTEYGISLNVDPNLKFLNTFEMCGLKQKRATSIREQKPESEVPVKDVAHMFVREVAEVLSMDRIEYVSGDKL